VASAFASVLPLCVALQPFETEDKKEAPYVLGTVEVEERYLGWSWGTNSGRWRPSRAVGMSNEPWE